MARHREIVDRLHCDVRGCYNSARPGWDDAIGWYEGVVHTNDGTIARVACTECVARGSLHDLDWRERTHPMVTMQ